MKGLTATILALVFFAAGVLAGITAMGSPAPASPQPLKSNMEMLGEVTTVIDPDSPLVKELERDDRLRKLSERDDWK